MVAASGPDPRKLSRRSRTRLALSLDVGRTAAVDTSPRKRCAGAALGQVNGRFGQTYGAKRRTDGLGKGDVAQGSDARFSRSLAELSVCQFEPGMLDIDPSFVELFKEQGRMERITTLDGALGELPEIDSISNPFDARLFFDCFRRG